MLDGLMDVRGEAGEVQGRGGDRCGVRLVGGNIFHLSLIGVFI